MTVFPREAKHTRGCYLYTVSLKVAGKIWAPVSHTKAGKNGHNTCPEIFNL
jgi:hypothetical protein